MVGFFPSPYPDELLYSLLARYHAYSLNNHTVTTVIDLFGKHTVRINTWLQGNLKLLYNNLPVNSPLNVDKMIDDHSILSVFTPFIVEEFDNGIRRGMINVNSVRANFFVKIGAGGYTYDSSLYYCPRCMISDKEKYGEAYWHRVHQIPGAIICPFHEELLVKYSPYTKSGILNLYHLENILDDWEPHIYKNLKEFTKLHLVNISKDLHWLLINSVGSKPPDYYYSKYRFLLSLKGFNTPNNKLVRIEELKKQIIDFYGNETLKLLQCDFSENQVSNWFRRILSKPKGSFSPLQHILMARYLTERPIKEFFEIKETKTIYGNGPWVCLNTVAPHYMGHKVTNISVRFNHVIKKHIGTFKCEECGFTYSVLGIPKYKIEKANIYQILDYGWLWKNELKQLVKQNEKLKAISSKLDVSTYVIKRQAGQLNLKISWALPSLINEQKLIEKKIKENRKKWLQIVVENPGLQQSKLTRKYSAIAQWLNKHDRDWFDENSPKRCKNKGENNLPRNIVDWEKRDVELLASVKTLIENWNDDEKPIRITRSRIASILEISYLKKRNFNLLPLTISYIESEAESVEDFQIRRAKKAINILKKNEKRVLTKRGIYDLANIHINSATKKLEHFVIEELKRLDVDE